MKLRALYWSFALGMSALCASGAGAQAGNANVRVPVLVELFTSEGCSDCPPADRLLEQLDATQPIAGVKAIVLSEHVTYWNQLGWQDPFSLEGMTHRQEDYVRRFGLDSSYTPQMVLDGAIQFVGNDPRALNNALTTAGQHSKHALQIVNAQWVDGAARFAVQRAEPSDDTLAKSSGARLVVALAADATRSEVSRGENAGRKLHHVSVVRVLTEFNGDAADGRELHLSGGSLSHHDEANGPVRLVVWLADRKNGHVLGAAEQTLTR